MSNPYFDPTAYQLIDGTGADAADVNNPINALEVSFDSLILAALQKRAHSYAASTGSSGTYAVTLSPVPASYAAGMKGTFKANHANPGAATLNVNSLGPVALKKMDGSALSASEIPSGAIVNWEHDGTNIQVLVDGSGSAAAAATSAAAAASSATDAQTAHTGAETAETNAETAETNAETAQTASEAAQTGAETAETNAASSAVEAAASASAAAASAELITGANNLINNPEFLFCQRSVTGSFSTTSSFGSTDGTYLWDQWVLLADSSTNSNWFSSGDGGVDGLSNYANISGLTAEKKFGFFQPIESKRCAAEIAAGVCSLSFDAKVSDITKLSDIRAVVVAWDGASDNPTLDIVSAWEAEGVNPTLVANWTAENVAVDLEVTASWARYTIPNIILDTSGTKNLGIFIYQNNVATADTTEELFITNIQLEPGLSCSDYRHIDAGLDKARCESFLNIFGHRAAAVYSIIISGYAGAGAEDHRETITFPLMRKVPTVTINDFLWTATNTTATPVAENATERSLTLKVVSSAAGVFKGHPSSSAKDGIEISAEL